MTQPLRLCGRSLAAALHGPMAARARAVAARRGRPVGLGMIVLEGNAASDLYVRNKARAAQALGLHSEVVRLPPAATAAQVSAAIAAFNGSDAVDAFLLQMPLPAPLDGPALITQISPHKDADGLHPHNVGRAMLGLPGPRPCTPQGCMRLIAEANVRVQGATATVIGRSAIVGQPMALMLSQADATVTLCHAQTVGLAAHVREAQIVVAAAGVRNLVPGHWLRPGAVVIDVGISRFVDAAGRTRVGGDVHYASAARVAAAITPVPGGVGPMTIAMLMHNAIEAAQP